MQGAQVTWDIKNTVNSQPSFRFPDAVGPVPGSSLTPKQGYRRSIFRDPASGTRIPVLAAAVSREDLFSQFLGLLMPLGEVVDVVLETSHQESGASHVDLFREHIDLPVLESYFWEFEDLLVNDGCTGVAVISTTAPMEVQFDEHKLIIVYAHDLKPFEDLLVQGGIFRDDKIKLITEGEHLHLTKPEHQDTFQEFCYRLGVREPAGQVNW